jgi:hypothetical protein
MRLSLIIGLMLLICCSEDNYEDILSIRLREIEKSEMFDNSFVVYSETEGYGSNFPKWSPDVDYYEYDVVLSSAGKMYEAIKESKGKQPETSLNEWRLIPWRHPYFFLRDTAKKEDLRRLLRDKHPYIRTYAFGALAHKDSEDLFNIILNNLADTTRMTQITGDVGFDVCPADLMISYELEKLTKEQTEQLRKLIETKYNHLTYAKRLLANE